MIIVLVEVGVEPGAVDKVRDAVGEMEQATRNEAGCVGYAFSSDVCNPGMVRVTERWQSLDALRAHIKAPHMADFQAAVMQLQPKSLDIKAYEVAREIELPRD
jgi:quinol monooxygenase YgiN